MLSPAITKSYDGGLSSELAQRRSERRGALATRGACRRCFRDESGGEDKGGEGVALATRRARRRTVWRKERWRRDESGASAVLATRRARRRTVCRQERRQGGRRQRASCDENSALATRTALLRREQRSCAEEQSSLVAIINKHQSLSLYSHSCHHTSPTNRSLHMSEQT